MVSDVVERFMRYVQIDSQADPNGDGRVPSTECQFDVAREVADDLIKLGCDDVVLDDHAYVTASFPASKGCEDLPALGFCCHLDTSFDAPAEGVKPHIVHYTGGNLVAGVVDGKEIFTSPEEVPYLNQFVDQDIICSDGSTLLSVDDKAGVAEAVSLIHRFVQNPDLPHPTIKLAFVPDEEIGHGASLLDLEKFGAAWAYTIDTGELGKFNYECFNACEARVVAHGRVVHPGTAKDRLINAILVLEQFNALLPAAERPEHTSGYEGFFHVVEMTGNSHEATYTYIVRDFDAQHFQERKQMLLKAADFLNKRYGEGTVEVKLKDQYCNMSEGFANCQFVIDNALKAYEQTDIVPLVVPIRGGTDGAQLTLRGLPCPNLATGGTSFHSVREFIPVSALEKTVDMLENLCKLYAVELQQ